MTNQTRTQLKRTWRYGHLRLAEVTTRVICDEFKLVRRETINYGFCGAWAALMRMLCGGWIMALTDHAFFRATGGWGCWDTTHVNVEATVLDVSDPGEQPFEVTTREALETWSPLATGRGKNGRQTKHATFQDLHRWYRRALELLKEQTA